jgi:hypothetical protein
MRGKWLAVIAVASLCLNAAVVGTYFYRQLRFHRRFRPAMTPETHLRLKQARERFLPVMESMVGGLDSAKDLLWSQLDRSDLADSEIDSLTREIGRMQAVVDAAVFRQVRRELQTLPPDARGDYIKGFRQPRHGKHGRHRGMKGPGRFGPPPRPDGN